MRKKIPKGIITFVSLSSIMTIALVLRVLWVFDIDEFVSRIPSVVFALFYIRTITCLILLKNRARITYIVIHIILASSILFLSLMGPSLLFSYIAMGAGVYSGIIIALLLFIYSIISIIYFLQSDTAKLFKQ